ncbi:MAG: hypothetical protein GXP08_15785 [Gammaproteobacteria bacterium]|nr:hypothetical protein [Gammaproteobacteria bacterium]
MHFRVMAPVVFVFIGFCVVGCSGPMPTFDLEPTANKIFNALQAQDVDTALSYYSDDFYEVIPKSQWRHRLTLFEEKVGPIEGFRLRKKQADTRFSGKFYIYQYETTHKGNKKARHILTFIHPFDGDEVKLVAHKITAKNFP